MLIRQKLTLISGFAKERRTALKHVKSIGLLALSLLKQEVAGQPVLTPDPKFWTPNGPVSSILTMGDTVYLAGDFSYIGPRTGPAAAFAMANGQPLGAPPRINGTVRAVAADGTGGWYIGGIFTRIGETAATNVARLNADLSVDTGWNPRVVGTAVNSLVVSSNRVYMGGQFTRVGGQLISGLVGLNADDGAVEWNPHLTGSAVNALELANGILYVGGVFTVAGGANRQNLAAISTTGEQATPWNPGADGSVLALAVDGGTVYVGGQFNNTGTKPRSRLAALDATTGVASTWNPNPNGFVRTLAAANGAVYVGGDFTTISVASRRGFAVLNGTTGAAGPLDLQLTGGTTVNVVRSLLLRGDVLYVGGQFTGALGESHIMSVGVDLVTGESLPAPLTTDFNGAANANFGINAMAEANGRVFVGGDFTSFGGVARQRAAALSLTTGAPLAWAPAFDAPVLAMVSGPSGIFLGGSFSNVNGSVKARGLALVDPASGNPVAFPFAATNGSAAVVVRTLAVGGNILYAGGAFTVVTNLARRFVVALNANTGVPVPSFDAKLTGGSAGVSASALSGDKLYLAGDFTAQNGVAMARLTGVSSLTGAALPWTPKPNPNQGVNGLVTQGDRLYVAGQFTTISGVTLRDLAVYQMSDNSLLPLDAALPNGAVLNSLAASATTLYLGGTFTTIGGESRRNLASLATGNATAFDWNPSPDVGPSVLTLDEEYVLAGGTFRFIGGEINGFFGAFPRAPKLTVTRDAANVRIAGNNGDRAEAVWQSAPALVNPVWTSFATNGAGFPSTAVLPIGAGNQFFRAVAR